MWIKILRLPLYHCELNAIELVWSETKRYIASNNTTFKENDVKKFICEAYSKISEEKWTNYDRHIVNEEKIFWEADLLQDDIEPFIINLNDASDDSDTESDEDVTHELHV